VFDETEKGQAAVLREIVAWSKGGNTGPEKC
jgi:hypothetical protein